MKPVMPQQAHEGGEIVTFAKDQPEYEPLPASRDTDGLVMCEWELSDEERALIAQGARIRLWIHTFNSMVLVEKGKPRRNGLAFRLQPVQLEVGNPIEKGSET